MPKLKAPPRIAVSAQSRRRLLIVADQAGISGSNFVFTLLVARNSSLSGFGEFSVAWLAVLTANTLQMAHIVLPYSSMAGRDPDNTSAMTAHFGRSQLRMIGATLLVGLSAVLLWTALGLKDPSVVAIAVLVCVTYQWQEFVRRIAIVRGALYRALLTDCVAYGARFLPYIFVPAWMASHSPSAALLALSGAYLVGAVVLQAFARNPGLKPDLALRRAIATEHRSISRYLVPAGVMQWLSVNSHFVGASILLGPSATGVMRASQSLTAVGNIALQSLDTILPQRLSQVAANSDAATVRSRTLLGVALSTLTFLPIGILLTVFGSDVLGFLYGAKFRPFGYAVGIYAIVFCLAVMSYWLKAGLLALQRQRAWFNSYLATTVVTLPIVAPLQLTFGIRGALTGMVASYVVLVAAAAWGLYRDA